jgi:hypothetical protein
MQAAIATTSLGLELVLGPKANVAAAARALEKHPADGLFRAAWSAIHRDVVVPARARAKERPDDDTLRALTDECPTLRGSFLATRDDLARAREYLES